MLKRPAHFERAIIDRIAKLAIIRELQVNRQTDIVMLRERLNIRGAEGHLRGVVTQLKNAGAIAGEPAGTDPRNNYPYKRWSLIDDKEAKRVARDMRIRLMPSAGKQHIGKCEQDD